MQLEAEIEQLRDTLRGRDGAGFEMHFEAEIKKLRDPLAGQDQVELKNALGGRDQANLEIM